MEVSRCRFCKVNMALWQTLVIEQLEWRGMVGRSSKVKKRRVPSFGRCVNRRFLEYSMNVLLFTYVLYRVRTK